jgi:hypothetical protein
VGLFGRGRRRLPGDRRPPLDPGERVLAWAPVPDGALVATNLGLWLPAGAPAGGPAGAPAGGPADGPGLRRLGWHEIHKVTWTGQVLSVTPARTVAEADGYQIVEDLPTVGYPLAEPGELPDQVRGRVTRSVGYTAHHPVAGGAGVRVVARRVPGRNGLVWAVRYDPGLDRDDPVVREITSGLVAQARDAG